MTTLTTMARPTAPASIQRLLARHPILGYFAIAFAGTWLLLFVPVLAQNGLGLLPFMVPDIAMLLLFVGATLAGPTLGAIVMTAATAGKPALRQFFRRYVQVRVGLRWYLLILLGPPLIGLLAACAYFGLAPIQTALARWSVVFTAYLPATLIFMIFPALGEEPGWRGYALPRLEQRYGPLLGALLLGLLHMLWHLPVFFMTKGQMAMGPFNAGDFAYKTFTSLVLSVIWTWVFNNAQGSIFIALVLHGASNAIGVLVNAWGAQFSTAGVSRLGDILLAVCTLLMIVFTRADLSYTTGLGLPPPEAPAVTDQPLSHA
jgi:membrane protease YdiL (CAAX protease family)